LTMEMVLLVRFCGSMPIDCADGIGITMRHHDDTPERRFPR
jgi:hypothetical protein